jgi:hypothetical protein
MVGSASESGDLLCVIIITEITVAGSKLLFKQNNRYRRNYFPQRREPVSATGMPADESADLSCQAPEKQKGQHLCWPF